jgi:hypothetical protein
MRESIPILYRPVSDDDVTPLEPPTSMPSKPVDPFKQPPPQEAIDMATQMTSLMVGYSNILSLS